MTQDILERNNVTTLGKGEKPIIFAHGFGCDQRFWRLVTPAFEDEYRIILFDYVGSGKSDQRAYKPERYRSLGGYAQDVIEICNALALEDVVFVGHSVSSIIGILASFQAPKRFRHLILIGASPSYFNDPPDYMGGYESADIAGLLDMMEKNYMGWANFVAPAAMKNANRPELAHELEQSFIATDHAIMHEFAAATFLADYREVLPRVNIPSLIMQTADDMFVPLEVAHYLHRQLPTSTLACMQATGHFPHLSAPAETIAVIQTYLDKVRAN